METTIAVTHAAFYTASQFSGYYVNHYVRTLIPVKKVLEWYIGLDLDRLLLHLVHPAQSFSLYQKLQATVLYLQYS